MSERTIIPAYHEATVPVQLEGAALQPDDHNAFEPLRAIKTQRPWRAARCLLQAPGWGDIYLRVMNPTGENLTLYPGRRLGTWELLTEAQVAGVRVLDTSTAGARQPAGQAGAATVMSVQEE